MFRVFLINAIEDYSKVFHSHEPLAGERRNKLKGRISVTTPIAARIRNYSARLRRRQLGRSDEGLRPCRELMPIKLGNSSNIITVGSAQCVVAAALLAKGRKPCSGHVADSARAHHDF